MLPLGLLMFDGAKVAPGLTQIVAPTAKLLMLPVKVPELINNLSALLFSE